MELNGAIAVVTGANRGLGRHLATQLLERGASVYAAVRRPDHLDLPAVQHHPRVRAPVRDREDPFAQPVDQRRLPADLDMRQLVLGQGVGSEHRLPTIGRHARRLGRAPETRTRA